VEEEEEEEEEEEAEVISPHSLEILQNAARNRSLVLANYPECSFTGNMAPAACDSRAAYWHLCCRHLAG
jgi:hypothetical protein